MYRVTIEAESIGDLTLKVGHLADQLCAGSR